MTDPSKWIGLAGGAALAAAAVAAGEQPLALRCQAEDAVAANPHFRGLCEAVRVALSDHLQTEVVLLDDAAEPGAAATLVIDRIEPALVEARIGLEPGAGLLSPAITFGTLDTGLTADQYSQFARGLLRAALAAP